jgi:hypothetical protein
MRIRIDGIKAFAGGAAAAVAAMTLAPALSAAPSLVIPSQYEIAGNFSEGCFSGCLCPVFHFGQLEGSFTLVPYQIIAPIASGPVQTYQIIDLEMRVTGGLAPVLHSYTGSGQYTIINGIIQTHQLTLDLTSDKGEVLHLDSGMIPGGEAFPDIVADLANILIENCYGQWFSLAASPAPAPNPADLNGDGVVNGLDLGILLNQWTGASGILCGPICCPADLNGDCLVNGLDLGILLANWTVR